MTPTTPGGWPDASKVQTFQHRVGVWIEHCFGACIGADRIERNHRFIEEALELVQSNGCTESEALQLVAYVFGRPKGEIVQEVGGVMNTLAALCNASGVDLNDAAETELRRVWNKSDQIRAKQAAKPKHSPLPEQAPPDVAALVAAAVAREREACLSYIEAARSKWVDNEFADVNDVADTANAAIRARSTGDAA